MKDRRDFFTIVEDGGEILWRRGMIPIAFILCLPIFLPCWVVGKLTSKRDNPKGE